MVLVDTSVWVDFLRAGESRLALMLEQGRVAIHPMVIGELACGNLRNRQELIMLWRNLPQVVIAEHREAMYCLENHALMGKGIGYVDLHLLTSTLMTPNTLVWTRDRRLEALAQQSGIGYPTS